MMTVNSINRQYCHLSTSIKIDEIYFTKKKNNDII